MTLRIPCTRPCLLPCESTAMRSTFHSLCRPITQQSIARDHFIALATDIARDPAFQRRVMDHPSFEQLTK